MNLQDVRQIRREFDAKRRTRLSANERRIGIAREQNAVHRATEQKDPKATARLVVELAFQLKDGCNLSFIARDYLHRALIKTALNPRNAAAAFGLVGQKKRPPSNAIQQRDAEIVAHLLELGEPIEPHFPVVADKWHLGVERIKQIWDKAAPSKPRDGRKAGNGMRPLIKRMAKSKSRT